MTDRLAYEAACSLSGRVALLLGAASRIATDMLITPLGREGITVNCICPGPMETGLTRRFSAEDRATFARRTTALGRYGRPEELAHMILSLCLAEGAFVTGAVIPSMAAWPREMHE